MHIEAGGNSEVEWLDLMHSKLWITL